MKTVMVTGASSGIGEATARKLVEDGYTVYVAARRLEKMNALVERGATAVQMDVAKEVTGQGAGTFLFLRRWTTDRMYDRIMRRFAG